MNKPAPPVKKSPPPARKAKPEDLDLNKDEDFGKLQQQWMRERREKWRLMLTVIS